MSDSSYAALRRFGLLSGSGLVIMSLLWNHTVGAVIGLILVTFGILSPVLLSPLYKAVSTVGACISWLGIRIVLVLLFYLVITPLGTIRRLFSKNQFDLEFPGENENTFWKKKAGTEIDRNRLEQQF